ncbi:N-terminal asparagine amidohydrolase-like protein [Lindgomyces ingoldianus]|uniref:N-terminal asparagine amidohydrolase-like protein n=1 Tax=Lindgomyces ingoldianus TaxID=673940 RepID=A0ACB6R621_9PLEO|nr:N-terminal asparagine amidohydrolase-like protein [Lindgomyces ingoldianus]KAF2474235.1 N-terminal asparagine amidohydrolase-like protein [Lindgomyces ingoldianus]
MKIACLQFAPELGKVQENIKRAEDILLRTHIPANLDWLVLPELAFSGYDFHSLEEIAPFLEPTTSGITTQWAIQTAALYKCHVTVGYPEITTTDPKTQYNSTVTVSPTGVILTNYRKAFLYYTDETWAIEGPSRNFFSGQLGGLGNVTLGICMDINPYKFTAPWTDYEFANTALQAGSPLVCVSMAWLCHLTPEELMQNPTQADFATVAYWVERFQPFVEKSRDGQPVVVVLANRCGMEKEVCYAGSTTILKIDAGGVSLYETLGKLEEKCLVVDLNERPKFQVRSGR